MIWKPILLEQWHLDTAGAVPAVNLNCTLQFVRSPILPRHLSNAWKKTQLFRYFTTCGTATNLSSPSHPIGSLEKKMAHRPLGILQRCFAHFSVHFHEMNHQNGLQVEKMQREIFQLFSASWMELKLEPDFLTSIKKGPKNISKLLIKTDFFHTSPLKPWNKNLSAKKNAMHFFCCFHTWVCWFLQVPPAIWMAKPPQGALPGRSTGFWLRPFMSGWKGAKTQYFWS